MKNALSIEAPDWTRLFVCIPFAEEQQNATTTAPSILIPRGIPMRFPPMMWVRVLLSLLFTLAVMVLLTRIAARTLRSKWLLAPAMVVVFGVVALEAGCAGGGGRW